MSVERHQLHVLRLISYIRSGSESCPVHVTQRLRPLYWAVVIARLLYTVSACWSFIKDSPRPAQCIEGFLRHDVHAGAAMLLSIVEDRLTTAAVPPRSHQSVNRWNNLTQDQVDAPSVNSFKNHLEKRRYRKMDFFVD